MSIGEGAPADGTTCHRTGEEGHGGWPTCQPCAAEAFNSGNGTNVAKTGDVAAMVAAKIGLHPDPSTRWIMPTPEEGDPEGVAEGRYEPRAGKGNNEDDTPDADAATQSMVNLEKARAILARLAVGEPRVPPAELIDTAIQLLYRAANPDGTAGHARSLDVDYPTKWLPAPMAAQLAAAGSLPAGGVGAALLGCGSAACMASRLLIDDTREVVPTCWVPSIGDQGSGKSPAARIVWAPYQEHQDKEANRYATAMEAWTKLDKKEQREQPKPANDSKLAQDLTLEALARRLKASHDAVAVFADELLAFLQGIGQYKTGGGSDKPRVLSLWSAEPWTYERVGDNLFIHISRPVLPVFGTIQPEYAKYLGDIGSGLQARWLPHWCGQRQGDETGRTAYEWEAAMRVLLNCVTHKRTWTMPRDSEARQELLAAEARWAAEAHGPEQTSESTGFLTKGGEHAPRIALVLAEISAAGDAAARGDGRVAAGQIPAWAVRGAVDIVDYCAAVWRMLPGSETPLTLSYTEARIAEKDGVLNAWLRRRGGSGSRAEIQANRVAGARTPAAVDALIARHKEMYGEQSVALENRNGKTSLRVYAR